MRVIETKIYKFEELTEEAKESAIDNIREMYYQCNDFAEWAIDDDFLLNPPFKELGDLGIDENYPILIGNNRRICFSLDRDRHIDISNALVIEDEKYFFLWLGIPEALQKEIYDYDILSDSISFDFHDLDSLTNEQNNIFDNAVEKFEDHCHDILKSIEDEIDYRFSDEAIKEEIQGNSYEFTEGGTIY